MDNPNSRSSKEETFWNTVGDKILQDEDELIVRDAKDFLTGSMVAFDYAMNLLGDLSGKTVLDYGCGSGWLSVLLAREKASICAFDISSALVKVTRERAKHNGLEDRIEAERMLAEELKYPSEYFDAVFGISILHHVDLDKSITELHRVLKRDGKAVFIEPLGESFVLNFVRRFRRVFPYHGISPAEDTEEPLTYEKIEWIGNYFSNMLFREFQFIGMLERLLGHKITVALGIDKLDSVLLEHFPVLRKQCRLVVISLINKLRKENGRETGSAKLQNRRIVIDRCTDSCSQIWWCIS